MRRQPRHAVRRPPRRVPRPPSARRVLSAARAHLPAVHLPPVHLPSVHVPSVHLRISRVTARLPSPRRLVWSAASRLRRHWVALPLERRRVRALVAAAVGFATIVLLTSFPLTGLLSQGAALSSTARDLSTVDQQNRNLAGQAGDLSSPSIVDDLARQEFGLVPRGQRAFDILPATAGTSGSISGQVPLNEPPVSPGSTQAQALIGIPPTPAGDEHHDRRASSTTHTGSPEPHGYWARVVRSLEFWS